jgi:hypothetical protein
MLKTSLHSAIPVMPQVYSVVKFPKDVWTSLQFCYICYAVLRSKPSAGCIGQLIILLYLLCCKYILLEVWTSSNLLYLLCWTPLCSKPSERCVDPS